MTASLTCPKCKRALPDELINQVELKRCHWCQTPVMIEIFPAMNRPIAAGSAAEALMMEGESGCFYHPEKKAVVPCEACGRFLCALCDCEVRGQHFCPSCLETGRKKGKMT